MKWIAPLLAYLAVGIGLFIFHSAWGALLGFHAAIVVSLIIAKPDIPLQILTTSKKIKWIFLNVILYLLWDKFGFANDFPAQVASLGLNESSWMPFIAYFASINPFMEEYFWRGWLGGKTKSLHISDFLYAGFHGLVLVNMVQTGSIIFALESVLKVMLRRF